MHLGLLQLGAAAGPCLVPEASCAAVRRAPRRLLRRSDVRENEDLVMALGAPARRRCEPSARTTALQLLVGGSLVQ